MSPSPKQCHNRRHAPLPAGRVCLELGAGTGMVAVALHRVGAARVICTDGNEQALDNCRRNLHLNGVPLRTAAPSEEPAAVLPTCGAASGGVECWQLWWEDGWDAARGPQPDVVLGADLLYDPCVIPTVLALLRQVLTARRLQAGPPAAQGGEGNSSSGGEAAAVPEAYLATRRRHEATMQKFIDAANAPESGLQLEEVLPPGTAQGSDSSSSRPVRFQHYAALDAARDSIVLHRLTLAAAAAAAPA